MEPPYEYISGTAPKEFDTRDNYGGVKTGPRNVYTNGMKSGYGNTTTGHLFGNYEYKNDPYENRDERNLDDLINHRKKILQNTKPFCSTSHGKNAFTADEIVYGDKDYQVILEN